MALKVHCELIARERILNIVPLLHERNPSLTPETLTQRVHEMVAQGYQCLGAYMEGELIAIAGIWIKTRYHTGKVIEADNVYVREKHRSKKVANQMMHWIYHYGREQGCLESELHCYTSNTRGHRFWLNQGYDIAAFHFIKKF